MSNLILDASIIISWSEELQDTIILDKLGECGYTPMIPKKVAEEIISNNQITKKIYKKSRIVKAEEENHRGLSNRFFRLGKGEVAVLAIGKEFEKKDEDYFCVLDDIKAREACKNLGLNLKGTLGILGILVVEGVLEFEQACNLVQKMKDKGTRLPENHEALLEKKINEMSSKYEWSIGRKD